MSHRPLLVLEEVGEVQGVLRLPGQGVLQEEQVGQEGLEGLVELEALPPAQREHVVHLSRMT